MIKKMNYETIQTLEEGQNTPLSPVELFGYKKIDENTGEVLAEKPNWFCPVERVGTPTFKEEVGEEILQHVAKPSDLKARVRALINGRDLTSLYGDGVEISDKEIMAGLDDDEDKDSIDFNEAMQQSPYFCDDKGISNFEKTVARSEEERELLQQHMAQMGHPFFQEFMSLPQEQREAMLAQAKATIDKGEPSTEPNGSRQGEEQ